MNLNGKLFICDDVELISKK